MFKSNLTYHHYSSVWRGHLTVSPSARISCYNSLSWRRLCRSGAEPLSSHLYTSTYRRSQNKRKRSHLRTTPWTFESIQVTFAKKIARRLASASTDRVAATILCIVVTHQSEVHRVTLDPGRRRRVRIYDQPSGQADRWTGGRHTVKHYLSTNLFDAVRNVASAATTGDFCSSAKPTSRRTHYKISSGHGLLNF